MSKEILIYMYIHFYMCVYMCVCMCMCVYTERKIYMFYQAYWQNFYKQ